jgi:carboxypeptidase Taq
MLTDDERNRYSRHLLLPQIGEEGQEKLKRASALIVGVGGLGSPAAMYLAAAGIGRLGLVDFDTVDESNLQRQILYGESVIGERKLDAAWKRLRDLNRNLRIETFNDRLSSRNALPLMEPYDIVLDDYERDMTTKQVRHIFDYLKEHQAPLVKEVAARDPERPPAHNFDLEAQKVFELEVIRAFGFTDDVWRLDPTVHPFASGTGITDIRITTRYFTEHLGGLFGTMHEFGHGLYERQVDESLERSPLARGVSLGMHESQSRMWENLVGRSLPFWRHFFPRLQELQPELAGYDVEQWYREANFVEPSLIRVESDEATYNLHIILRFELEQAMLADEFPLEQLPEQWNSRMYDYLGIDVPSDTMGVLQDVHWSGGSIGYFPTYALGNLISAQLWERITADLPDLEASFEAGEFATLRDWLRENLHRYGRKFTPGETLERVVGTSEIDPEPYVRYLREKLAAIYGIVETAA